MTDFHPMESLAELRHEFGEHGGVNMSIETSSTFTVMQAETLPNMVRGVVGPDEGGCFLYGRHFNPTVYVLARQIAISSVFLQIYGPGDTSWRAIPCMAGPSMRMTEHSRRTLVFTERLAALGSPSFIPVCRIIPITTSSGA